jgi:hypothetical protein
MPITDHAEAAMRVLVVEAEPGLSADTRRQLTEAGHEVVVCDTLEPHAPCRGLAMVGECPLDEGHTDVAVVHRVDETNVSGERGALCAARHRIPVVVAGEQHQPVSFGPGTYTAGRNLVASCEAVAASGAAHGAAIRRALLTSGVITRDDIAGLRPGVAFGVAREPDRLRLTIHLRSGEPRAANIRKAAAEALRRFDPFTRVIDVHVVTH